MTSPAPSAGSRGEDAADLGLYAQYHAILIHRLWLANWLTHGTEPCMRREGHRAPCIAAPHGYTPHEVTA
jgi:hypothetical protein